MNKVFGAVGTVVAFPFVMIMGAFTSTDFDKPDAKQSWHQRNPGGLAA